MRILFVTGAYYPELQFGGPPQKIHALALGMMGRGHQVRVVTLHSARRESRSASIEGVPVRYLPWAGKGSWKVPLAPRVLWRAVEWADVVHCFGLYNLLCPLAALAAGKSSVPYLLEPLGMYVPRARSRRAKGAYNALVTSWVARHAARVVATSPAEAGELARLAPGSKLVMRRNGIDLSQFEDLPGGDAFRNRFGIERAERIVLYIGRISPVKNLEQLIQAFREAEMGCTQLVLVGPALEPDYAAKLRKLVRGLHLERTVLFAGPLYGREKLEALAAADLFVLPSLAESFGNAAAEAVAARVPVLVTEGCGIAPLVHLRAGLSVPLHTGKIGEGMRALLDDPAVRASVTSRRAEVLAQLSWDEPLREAERVYFSVVGSR